MDKKRVEGIREVFKPVFDRVLGIVVYGSLAKGNYSDRSDIDICIIAPHEDSKKLYRETLLLNYDIRIFESMPLYLKMEVIKNHRIVYAKDIYKLYEYFYPFRKLWNDQEFRQRISKKEALHIFS